MKFSSVFFNPFKSSKPDVARDINQRQARRSSTTQDNRPQRFFGDQNASRNSSDSSSGTHLTGNEFSYSVRSNNANQHPIVLLRNSIDDPTSGMTYPALQTTQQQTSLQRRHSWPQEQDLESRAPSNLRPASDGYAVNDQTSLTTPSVSQSGSQQEVIFNSTSAATTPAEENYHDIRASDKSRYRDKIAKKKENYLAKLERIENSSLSGKELLKELKNANRNRPSDCKEVSQRLKNKIGLVTSYEDQMKAIATNSISVTVQGFDPTLPFCDMAVDTIFSDKLTQYKNLRSPIEDSEVLTQTMKDRLLKRLDFHTNFIEQRHQYSREKKHGAFKCSIPNHYEAAYIIFRREYKNGRNPYDKKIFKDLTPKEIREIVKTDSIGKGFDVWRMQKNWLGKNRPQTVEQKLALQQRAHVESTVKSESNRDDEIRTKYLSCDDWSIARSNIDDAQARTERTSNGTSEEFQNETLQGTLERIQSSMKDVDGRGVINIEGHDLLRYQSQRAVRITMPTDQDSDSSIYPTVSMLGESPTDAENGSISINLSHDASLVGTVPRPLQIATEEQSQTNELTSNKVKPIKRSIFSYPRNTVSRSLSQESIKPYQPANPLPIPANLSDLFVLGSKKESYVKNKNTDSARIAAAQNALSTLLATQLDLPGDALLKELAKKLEIDATELEKKKIADQAKADFESDIQANDRKSREKFVEEKLKKYSLNGVYKNLKPELIAKYGIEYDNKPKIVNSEELAERILAATKNHFKEKAKTTLTIFSSLQTQFANDKNDFVRGFTRDSRMLSLLRESNKTKQDDFNYYTTEINQRFNVETKAVNLSLINHLAKIVQPQLAVNRDIPRISLELSPEDKDLSELLQMM